MQDNKICLYISYFQDNWNLSQELLPSFSLNVIVFIIKGVLMCITKSSHGKTDNLLQGKFID